MTEEAKTTIRPDTSEYESARTAKGGKSMHNGDPVATALQGATLDEVYELVSEALDVGEKELRERYVHLNPGQQRMNLGNRLRGVMNKMDKEKDGSGSKYVTQLSSGVRAAVKGREKERDTEAKAKEKEKAAKVKEKAAAEAAKAKAAATKAKAKAKAA